MTDSGQAIRDWRHSQTPTVSLAKLAADVGTSKVSMSRIETGKQAITTDMLEKLVNRTGIAAAVLCPALAKVFAQAGQEAAQ